MTVGGAGADFGASAAAGPSAVSACDNGSAGGASAAAEDADVDEAGEPLAAGARGARVPFAFALRRLGGGGGAAAWAAPRSDRSCSTRLFRNAASIIVDAARDEDARRLYMRGGVALSAEV